jgi:hypothetical protein
MWLVFRKSSTDCHILEFEGWETIQLVRETLRNECNLSPNFILGFGASSLDNPSLTLNKIQDLHDLSEITLLEGNGIHFTPTNRIPVPLPSATPLSSKPQPNLVRDSRAEVRLTPARPESGQIPAPVVTPLPIVVPTPTIVPTPPRQRPCCEVA